MKELLQEINTSCKDCIFATWEEDTQIACDLGKIKLYKERKTPIIEAFDDEDKEFFVVKACAHLSVNNLNNSEIGLNLLPSNINLATCIVL